MSKGFGRVALRLSVVVLGAWLQACSSCDSAAGGSQDLGPYDDGGTEDADTPTEEAPSCESTECEAGQRCQLQKGEPVCVGDCDEVACEAGFACTVVGNVGECVAICDPPCGSGQRCEKADNQASCVDNTCDDLTCAAGEGCVPAPVGSGFLCVENGCISDVACAADEFCQDNLCAPDTCTAGVSYCDATGAVRECAANGSAEFERIVCSTAEGLLSACVVSDAYATCTCRDDWDCPANTDCVSGMCEGTGRAPTCFLPPLPFADLLPSPKPGFPWGGTDADGYDASKKGINTSTPPSRDAVGSPFQRHAQVSAVPVVANLDDDNGDGLINERDLPEIVFTSFCDGNYFNHGVLRALHAGGSKAGEDFFAVCENKLWKEGDPLVDELGAPLAAASCDCNAGDIEPTGAVAVGDLDGDRVPEIVIVGATTTNTSDVSNHRVLIFRNTGERISDNEVGKIEGGNPAVTLANLDGEGFAEIVIGPAAFFLQKDVDQRLVVSHVLRGSEGKGTNNGQGAIACVADLDEDGRADIVAGATAYRVPVAPAAGCPVDLTGLDDDTVAYCQNRLRPIWDHDREGFCAVADVMGKLPAEGEAEVAPGPLHPLDGKPEVVLIANGSLLVYDGATGKERLNMVLGDVDGVAPFSGRDGGAPNIDDFDGDGFPEIGTAFETFYTVYDFQPPTHACPAWDVMLDGEPNSGAPQATNPKRWPPAQACVSDADCGDTSQFACGKNGMCTCLHNGWRSKTQDASSRVTGSSVFDFNGDGAAEVVYNDECYFRIYEGNTGLVYQRLDSQSPTRIEYPVVADVDSDGNAEIVFSGSNARSESCAHSDGQTTFLNGVNVIGDPTDRWISARRMWNQHAYHITNIQEDGTIPAREVPSYRTYGGVSYNVYRSNLPPVGNVAPDLSISGLTVSSPDVQCGEALSQNLRIVALVVNRGDLRVGPEVAVRFFDASGTVLGTQVLGVSLDPGAETFVTLAYTAPAGALPKSIRAEIDPEQVERECVEDNNGAEVKVAAKLALPELSLTVKSLNESCSARKLELTVSNESDTVASDVKIAIYAGNPAAGGELLVTTTIDSVPAQAAETTSVDAEIGSRDVTLYAVVDPDRQITECDDSNNSATLDIACSVIVQ